MKLDTLIDFLISQKEQFGGDTEVYAGPDLADDIMVEEYTIDNCKYLVVSAMGVNDLLN